MDRYTYLIIGAGMAGAAAANGIRELDPNGTLALIGASHHPPYMRPPLSKGLWKGDPLDSIWIDLSGRNAELLLGRRAQKVDTSAREVTDDTGAVTGYDRLLIATGGTPRTFPWPSEDVLYYRGLSDYTKLRELAGRGERFVVIGSGFIGSEMAAALTIAGKKVTLLFPEEAIGARLYGAALSSFLNEFYRGKGVEVRPGEMVAGIDRRNGRAVVRTRSGGEFTADAVVAGLGVRPETAIAEAAGLTVEDGIIVDDRLRTSAAGVHAAGDVARFHQPVLERRIRVEHEDNANTMGRLAGRNMAGADEPYDHLPFFYSDLFELGYEAAGLIDARLQVVPDWKEPFREGVVYYLEQGRVRGVLLWNIFGQVDAARALMAEPGPFRPEDLAGRLPSS